jgi:beta-galactosidase
MAIPVFVAMLLALPSTTVARDPTSSAPTDGYYRTARQKRSINTRWRFRLGDVEGEPQGIDFDDSSWDSVSIPHTFKLTSLTLDGSTDDEYQRSFHRYVGWYRRHLTVSAAPDEKVYLEFEGAHQVTDVWVNGHHVGRHQVSAYSPFHFDVSDHVLRGGSDNVVALRLDNTRNEDIPPDGTRADYVLFGGLYRDVYLVVTDRLQITFPWEAREAGVFITTPSVSADNATVSVRTTVRNGHANPRECTLLTRIIDAEGRVVRTMKKTATIAPGATFTFSQVDGITEDLRLWSIDDPYLYRVNSTVFDGEEPVDFVENPLGIRWFELREDVGFLMNGEPVELVGVNRHQQYPYVGDAVPNSLHWKDALQFKQAGFNIVRLAHYPHDDSFVEACDRLGILLTEEPPTWMDAVTAAWMDNLETSLRVMVRNHRNHPSIVIWGAGINHRGALRRLHYAAKEEDPTRWTMSNSTNWTGLQASGVADIFSTMDYREVPLTDRYLFAMEHGGSRDGERNQLLVSRYRGSPERIGLTVWSAHDNNTLHRNGGVEHLARWGVLDTFRIPKPVYYWYQSELTSEPMVHIADRWDEPKIERVRVFSNCHEVELLLDGLSLGRRGPDRDPKKRHLRQQPFTFPVVWQAGELRARGYRAGRLVAEHSIRTPGKATHLSLRIDADQRTFTAGGGDVVLAYASVRDAHEQLITGSTERVTFSVEGPAAIVGDETIGANPRETEEGVAAVLVRSGAEPGLITLTARAEGLGQATAEVESLPLEEDVLRARARPIFSPFRWRVDIGAGRSHVEDGWVHWGEAASTDGTPRLDGRGVTVSIRALEGGGSVQWSPAADVAGPLGRVAEDGAFTMAGTGLELTLEGLAAGDYRLQTYHHQARIEEGGSGEAERGSLAAADMRVTVDDAGGHGQEATGPLGHSVGREIEGSMRPSHTDLAIRSNGVDDVTIRFTATSGRIWLNGFDLRQAP